MDDNQLERELSALAGEQAEKEQKSEAKTTTPSEGEEGQAETETEESADGDSDVGDDASEADDDGESENSDDEESKENDEKPKRRKKSGFSRLKDKVRALESENASLRSRTIDSEPTQDEIERLIGKPPKEEDFKGDFLAYERSLTAYELDKRQVAREMKSQHVRETEKRLAAKREAVDSHNERMEEFAEKVADFKQTLKDAASLKVSPIIEDIILDSDKSANLVYHLAKKPDLLAKLNTMSERDAAREIGRIEARLSLPNPKTQTKTPPPKAPPKGGSAPSSPEKELDAWLAKKYG